MPVPLPVDEGLVGAGVASLLPETDFFVAWRIFSRRFLSR